MISHLNDKMLRGKNAVVTGAGGGIGKAIVRRFAEEGINLWAIVHIADEDNLAYFARLEQECGIWIRVFSAEFTEPESAERVCREIMLEKESIDILVNNAGISYEKTLGMTPLSEMERVMRVNFMMPSYITQLLSRPMMRRKTGTIVNILSRAALENRSGVYAYGASKAALLWGTKAMAKELAAYHIRVNGIAPGLTETKMGTGERSEEQVAHYISKNNIKRPATPEEIANVVFFLASDESSYISGQVISVDGGRD